MGVTGEPAPNPVVPAPDGAVPASDAAVAEPDGPVTPDAAVIAIDGPAGAGKSTIASALARHLGRDHLDTGAMYRSVTWAALRDGIDVADGEKLAALTARLEIDVGGRVTVDGIDVTTDIRSAEVTAAVSTVSAHPEVRAELVRRQRSWVSAHGGGVVEGRDIGTVVFPDAELKVFLTASDDERARRRLKEIEEETGQSSRTVAADLARRDRLDATRAASPLVAAPDAFVIDTTDRDVAEVVDLITDRLRRPGSSR